MVEMMRLDPFIPNSIQMGSGGNPRSKIITGPNMGGSATPPPGPQLTDLIHPLQKKFSGENGRPYWDYGPDWELWYIASSRSKGALDAYEDLSAVPASSARLSMLDGVLTRMGGMH